MDFFIELEQKVSQLDLFADVSPMQLPTDDEGIALRPAPGSNESWQYNGDHTAIFGVQVLVRSTNWFSGWQEINKIDNLLNGANRESLGIDNLSFMEVSTSPNWIGEDDRKRHEFTALYQATLQKGGN